MKKPFLFLICFCVLGFNAGDFYPQIPNNHVIIEYWIRHRDSDCNNSTITLPWYWELIVTHAKLNCTGSGIYPDK